MQILLTACLAAVAAVAGTRAAISWLLKWGGIARENARSMHTGAVPKGGGGPLLAAVLMAVVISGSLPPASPPWIYLGVGTAILFALSWRDDLVHLPPLIRLAMHLGIAAFLVSGFPADNLVFQSVLPFWADRVAAILALAWMMNLYNFMDGINGIAGTETMSISIGYILVGLAAGDALPYAVLASALAGASAGFLVWNGREKALVFLGDAGSVPLGFLTGTLMLDLAQHGLWAAALILPAYFLADATLTLLIRVWRGERPWEAHKGHAFQRAASALNRHLPIVRRVAVVNMLLIGVAILSITRPLPAVALAVLIVAMLLFSLASIGRSRSLGSGRSRR